MGFPGGIQVRVRTNNVAAWAASLRAKVMAEMAASAERTLAAATNRAPVRTGQLQASGKITQISDLHFNVSFGSGLPDGRAIFQELGTSHHVAQPYLYPSFQEELPNLMARLATVSGGKVALAPGLGGASGLEINAG